MRSGSFIRIPPDRPAGSCQPFTTALWRALQIRTEGGPPGKMAASSRGANQKRPCLPQETKAQHLCGTTLVAARGAAPPDRLTASPVPAYCSGSAGPLRGDTAVVLPSALHQTGGSLGGKGGAACPHLRVFPYMPDILSVSFAGVKSLRAFFL